MKNKKKEFGTCLKIGCEKFNEQQEITHFKDVTGEPICEKCGTLLDFKIKRKFPIKLVIRFASIIAVGAGIWLLIAFWPKKPIPIVEKPKTTITPAKPVVVTKPTETPSTPVIEESVKKEPVKTNNTKETKPITGPLSPKLINEYFERIADPSTSNDLKEKYKKEMISKFFVSGDATVIVMGQNNTDVDYKQIGTYIDIVYLNHYRVNFVKADYSENKILKLYLNEYDK